MTERFRSKMLNAIKRRKLISTNDNVVASMRHELPVSERRAAVWCVLTSSDVCQPSRTDLELQYAQDDDVVIQRMAFVLGRWDADRIHSFLSVSNLDNGNRNYLLRALATFGDSGVLSQCAELVATDDEQMQCDATTIAGELGNQHAIEFLKTVLVSSASETTRTYATINLIRCRDFSHAKYLESRLNELDATTRVFAVGCLAVAGSHRGVALAAQILQSGDDQRKLMLRQCLCRLKVEEAGEHEWETCIRNWLENR